MGVISRFLGTAKSVATFSQTEMMTTLEAIPVREEYAIAANALPAISWAVGRPSWPTWDPHAGAKAYGTLALIYRCVNIVAHALGTAPVIVTDDANDNEPIEDHPLTLLMKRPNPNQGAASFWSHVGVRTATSGFCVVEKERDRLGNMIALWPLQSAWLKAKLRKDGRHDWEYRIPGVVEPFALDAEDVLVFRWADTASGSPYGIGPLEACLREVSLNNALIDFTKLYVERGAAPVFGLIPAADGPRVNQSEAEAIIDAWVARRGGLQNAVRPMYMGGIADIKVIGNNLEEMAYTALRDMNELGIVQAFGIPASVAQIRVGLEHSDSRANAEVDEAKLYRQTIIPLWTRFDDALTLGLLSEYPDSERVSLTFDTSDIEALQEDRNAKAVWVNASVNGGWLSVHAAHREMGLPLPEGDDYFLRSIALEAVPVTEPMPPKQPVPAALQPGNQPAPDDEDEDDTELAALNGHATTKGTGYRRRYTRAISGRVLIGKIAEARQPSIARFFAAQGARVLPTITERLDAAVTHERYGLQDVDWQREEDELAKVLRQLYALAGTQAFDLVGSETGIGLSFDLANPNLADVMDSLAQRVTGITDETRAQIQTTITSSLQEGVSIPELRDRLKTLFDGWTDARATTIARSESAHAFNRASVVGYRESGVVSECQLFDNGAHTTDPLPPTMTTCAQRDGMIVPLEETDRYIDSMHPNCVMAVAGVVE